MNRIEKLKEYVWLLEKWNLKMNLISYNNIRELIIDNIVDSLSVYEVYHFNKHDIVADVGTGPGIPGVVLSILNPDVYFYLIDPRKKYFMFLKTVKRVLGLNNVVILNKRIENIDKKFTVILNRAVADINTIIKLCNNVSDMDSLIFSYKGPLFFSEFPLKNNRYKINIIKKIKILEIYNKRLYIIGLKRY